MVENQQVEDNEAFMYGDESIGSYIQDADILDRPDLFYGNPGNLICNLFFFWFDSLFLSVSLNFFHPLSKNINKMQHS